MKGKRKVVLKRSIALAMSAIMTLGAPAVTAMAEEGDAMPESGSSSFIKADGKNLRTDYGRGEVINLRGTNAGGYLLQEFWMTPSGESAEVYDQTTILNNLTERFGEDEAKELVATWEEAYWQEEDFANCRAMGMNCIRLPFWWRNLVDEDGNYYGYDAEASDPYAKAFERLDWFVEKTTRRRLPNSSLEMKPEQTRSCTTVSGELSLTDMQVILRSQAMTFLTSLTAHTVTIHQDLQMSSIQSSGISMTKHIT